jgi:hypothetical protein
MSKSRTIDDVADWEEREIRDSIDQWCQPASAASSCGKLHINSDGEPLCIEHKKHNGKGPMSNDETEYVAKDTSVFPVGYRDVCLYCARVWREAKSDD